MAGGITATDIAVGVVGAGALMGLDRLMSSGLPPGFIPGDKGAEQWGRNNGIDPNDARGRFHGVKQSDKGVVATSTRLILKPVKCVTRTAT